MAFRIPLLAALVLLPGAIASAQPAPPQSTYVLQWNGNTVARFTAMAIDHASDATPSGNPAGRAGEPLAPALLLVGGDNYPALSQWNQSRDSRTVEIVTCTAGRPAVRQTFYGADPRALRVTRAGIELELAYGKSVVSALGGGASLCSQPPQPVATLFDRRFGRVWTVRTGNGGTDLWTFQGKNDGGSAYFETRENTTVTIEVAGATYIADYLGCQYRGTARGDQVELFPADRSPGTCSGNLGVLHATIVR